MMRPMPRWPDMDPSKRCAAHKKNGEQCQRARKPGTTVCTSHGAAAGHVKLAAERNVADAQALALATRMQVQVPRFQTPGEAASYTLAQIQRRAAQFGALADQLQAAVYTDRAGQERVRAVLAEERRWLDSMVKLLGVAVVAGSAAEPSGPSPVELFTYAAELFREDVDSALCDAGIYDGQHEKIMASLAARASLRVRQSQNMIIEQVHMMAEARSA